MVRRYRVQSYLRRVPGKKRRIRVESYLRNLPRKAKKRKPKRRYRYQLVILAINVFYLPGKKGRPYNFEFYIKGFIRKPWLKSDRYRVRLSRFLWTKLTQEIQDREIGHPPWDEMEIAPEWKNAQAGLDITQPHSVGRYRADWRAWAEDNRTNKVYDLDGEEIDEPVEWNTYEGLTLVTIRENELRPRQSQQP